MDILVDAKIKDSMHDKGALSDNRMSERFWRSLRYECINLFVFEQGSGAKAGIGK